MNDKITALKHRLNKIASLKDYQVELQQRIEENDAKLLIAYEILKKENHDVEKLQHASLSNVIAWFSHDKEERLAKEEREALQASIQVCLLYTSIHSNYTTIHWMFMKKS